jgi:hypothetical protein
MEFAQALQDSAFARWVGESGSLLGYPTILFLHTLGLATVAGLNAGINLRVLGVAPALPLSWLVNLYPAMWTAFAVTTASGLALLIADATTKLAQPIFYVKLLFVGLAVANLQLLRKRVLNTGGGDQRPLPQNAKLLAVTSFVFLLAATVSGRLMAYVY